MSAEKDALAATICDALTWHQWQCDGSMDHREAVADTIATLLAERDAGPVDWERVHRDLTSRLGFGDGITEPMADNDTIVEFVDQVLMEASEHHECPIVCELCGEKLAATICEHCHGSGGNNALIEATLAYSECEWCAGAGKVHVGCVERSYADLAACVAPLKDKP